MILTASKAANETATFKLDHSHVIVFTMIYEYIKFSKTNKVDSGGAMISCGRGGGGTPEWGGAPTYYFVIFCRKLHKN